MSRKYSIDLLRVMSAIAVIIIQFNEMVHTRFFHDKRLLLIF